MVVFFTLMVVSCLNGSKNFTFKWFRFDLIFVTRSHFLSHNLLPPQVEGNAFAHPPQRVCYYWSLTQHNTSKGLVPFWGLQSVLPPRHFRFFFTFLSEIFQFCFGGLGLRCLSVFLLTVYLNIFSLQNLSWILPYFLFFLFLVCLQILF